MGLFSGVTKAIGKVVGGLSGSDGVSLIGSALGFLGQERANDMNMDIASMNNETAIDLANTRYQRQVKDLAAAGLNPMLGYLKLDGGQVPQLQQARVENSGAAAVQGAQLALLGSQAKQAEANANLSNAQALEVEARTPTHALGMDLTREQINKIRYETANVLSNTHLTNAQTEKVNQEISNLVLQGDLTRAQTEDALARAGLNTALIKEVAPRINKLIVDTAYTRAATGWQETKGLIGNFAKGVLGSDSGSTLGEDIGNSFTNSAKRLRDWAKPDSSRRNYNRR